MNRVKIIVFIGDRYKKTCEIGGSHGNTKMQVWIFQMNRVHLSVMKASDNERQKRGNG